MALYSEDRVETRSHLRCITVMSAERPDAALTPRLLTEQLSLFYGQRAAVRDVSISIRGSEVVCLLGPSGSGKSSLLRLIAGLERPSAGRLWLDGHLVAGPGCFSEPERRAVGMVFQDFALFPHLTVAQNVAFGLGRLGRGEVSRRVAALLSRVDLARYADSYPHTLSGGERQRVALARALAPEPRILLMDEPFSSLDGRLREQVRRRTIDLLRELGTTTVVVTHDADEALRIADRIALLNEGAVVQVGTPQELYFRPASMFAARFFSDVNELPATVRDGRLETPLGVFNVPAMPASLAARVCIRPEHVRIAAGPTAVAGRVLRSEFRGEAEHVVVTVDGVATPLRLRTSGRGDLLPGDAVHLEIREDRLLVMPS